MVKIFDNIAPSTTISMLYKMIRKSLAWSLLENPNTSQEQDVK